MRTDLSINDPNFGKVEICVCRRRAVANQIRDKLHSLSNLDELQNLTFETFKPRGHIGISETQAESLEQVYNQAAHFAKSLNGWLLLQGSYGCGKTHLAAAIANYAVSMGVPTLFLTVPDLLDMLRFSYDSEDTTFEERFGEIRNANLLVLDDLGTQNATAWAQEKLFQILNYRYINHLPLVITTNLALSEIEERIRSRLQDPQLVTSIRIQAPDFRRPSDDIGQRELSSLGYLNKRTFYNFDFREKEGLPKEFLQELRDAYEAAYEYAENPEGWIVFVGPSGIGKTHLAAAIGNLRASAGSPPIFIVVPDLLDYLRATFSPDSRTRYDQRFEEIKTTQLLILDDLGSHAQTPWAREKLFQLINFRYNAELPTVITISVDNIKEVDPRIQSRLADGQICDHYTITIPTYKGTTTKKSQRTVARKRK